MLFKLSVTDRTINKKDKIKYTSLGFKFIQEGDCGRVEGNPNFTLRTLEDLVALSRLLDIELIISTLSPNDDGSVDLEIYNNYRE